MEISIIFQALLFNSEYTRTVLHHLKDEYFEEPHEKRILTYIKNYVKKYNNIPNKQVIYQCLKKDTKLNQQSLLLAEDLIKPLQNDNHDLGWLVDETENWCKDRAISIALLTSINIKSNNDLPVTDRNNKIPGIEVIPDILREALSVEFNLTIGHDYWKDSESRLQYYQRKVDKLPFEIDILNTITKGGVEKKSLNMLLSGTNVGKTLALCYLTAAYIRKGLKVVYITLEMAEEKIGKRIDANILNVDMDYLDQIEHDPFMDGLESARLNAIDSSLVIKEYPTGKGSSNDFRILLDELRTKKEFIPDVLMIDYLGLCRPTTTRETGSYSRLKAVAEELRGIGVEYEIAVWSASQTQRSVWSASDIGLDNTAESAGVPETCDFMLGIIETEENTQSGQQMVKQLKSRYGDKGIIPKFAIGVDKAKQKWFEVNNDDFIREGTRPEIVDTETIDNDFDF